MPLWNTAVAQTPIPTCQYWSEDLERRAAERIAQRPDMPPAQWARVFARVAASPCLRGETPGRDGTRFSGTTLDWFLTGPMHLTNAIAGRAPYIKPPEADDAGAAVKAIIASLLLIGVPQADLDDECEFCADPIHWQRIKNHIISTAGPPDAPDYAERVFQAFNTVASSSQPKEESA